MKPPNANETPKCHAHGLVAQERFMLRDVLWRLHVVFSFKDPENHQFDLS